VPFELADIRRVLDAFENSDCTEVTLVSGEYELTIASEGAPALDVPATAPNLSDKSAEPVADAPPAEETVDSGNTIDIVAPSIGIFWRSPQPGAPPFVAVGDAVTADSTTCIVEVMKLMNHVKAGVAGRVVRVHPDNGQQVAAGAPLITVEVPA
jgi:acetyl-CoA carboxylase biotin carboxyl carrier protein